MFMIALIDQEVELGETDVQVELVQPIQRLLDQTRAVRGFAKKLLKRTEDLIHESAALRTPILSKLNQLSTSSAGIVNFGVRLAQLIGDYISSVKEKKEVFYISKVSACVREAVEEINGGSAPAAEGIWEVPTQALAALIKEANAAATTALESENVTRSSYPFSVCYALRTDVLLAVSGKSPWVKRVEAIKSATALNVEAEHKVIKLNEEMQELVRTIKAREQTIQETAVKIQVLERRMEAHRKQAETVADMEEQLKNEKKQVKMYEEAMETLQAEMEALHQDNAKLKQNLANPERQSMYGPQHRAWNLTFLIQLLGSNIPSKPTLFKSKATLRLPIS
jgi:dynactin 1